jgi:hypothetical protein
VSGISQLRGTSHMPQFNETVEAPILQSSGGDGVMRRADGGGGIVQLFHPGDHNRPHVELVGNETTIAKSGGGLVNVADGGGQTTIQLNGQTGTITASGDIILTQADCSEDFDVEAEQVEPGSVMVIYNERSLKESDSAYDSRVAGVVSGAGDYRPALILDRQPASNASRAPIALSGKVFCKVDADYSPIDVGDLLVTSPTRGHAMKATNYTRAFGAVLGKALRGFENGRGLIPILVSLQ